MKDRRLFLGAILFLALFGMTACGNETEAASASSAAMTSAPAASAAPSAVPSEPGASAIPSTAPTGDLGDQWCTAYSNITSVLADAGVSPQKAKEALGVLEKFYDLWDSASTMEVVSPDEAAANQRAVARYAAIVQLFAGGAAKDSPEVTAAAAKLTATTEADHDLLASSAATILGMCGPAVPPSSSPSASASPTSG